MVDITPEDQIEERYDQSLFTSTQSVLQAPPQPILSEEQIRANKKKKLIWIGVGVFLFLMLALILSPKRRRTVIESTPEPSPSPVVQQTEMQQQLHLLEQETTRSDPDKTLVSPPQIDMQVEF